MAQGAWEFGNAYTISPAQATARSLPTKNITLAQNCQSGKSVSSTELSLRSDKSSGCEATLAGGTFYVGDGLDGNRLIRILYTDVI
jgi:hypothetical protein